VQSRLEEIRGANGEVFGISADSPFSLAKWAEQEGYTFDLLSDFGKETIAAYDTMYPELAGLKGVPKRSAFLIDGAGNLVRQEISEDAKVIPDLNGFIAEMKSLG
jgi:peroxiredoxin